MVACRYSMVGKQQQARLDRVGVVLAWALGCDSAEVEWRSRMIRVKKKKATLSVGLLFLLLQS